MSSAARSLGGTPPLTPLGLNGSFSSTSLRRSFHQGSLVSLLDAGATPLPPAPLFQVFTDHALDIVSKIEQGIPAPMVEEGGEGSDYRTTIEKVKKIVFAILQTSHTLEEIADMDRIVNAYVQHRVATVVASEGSYGLELLPDMGSADEEELESIFMGSLTTYVEEFNSSYNLAPSRWLESTKKGLEVLRGLYERGLQRELLQQGVSLASGHQRQFFPECILMNVLELYQCQSSDIRIMVLDLLINILRGSSQYSEVHSSMVCKFIDVAKALTKYITAVEDSDLTNPKITRRLSESLAIVMRLIILHEINFYHSNGGSFSALQDKLLEAVQQLDRKEDGEAKEHHLTTSDGVKRGYAIGKIDYSITCVHQAANLLENRYNMEFFVNSFSTLVGTGFSLAAIPADPTKSVDILISAITDIHDLIEGVQDRTTHSWYSTLLTMTQVAYCVVSDPSQFLKFKRLAFDCLKSRRETNPYLFFGMVELVEQTIRFTSEDFIKEESLKILITILLTVDDEMVVDEILDSFTEWAEGNDNKLAITVSIILGIINVTDSLYLKEKVSSLEAAIHAIEHSRRGLAPLNIQSSYLLPIKYLILQQIPNRDYAVKKNFYNLLRHANVPSIANLIGFLVNEVQYPIDQPNASGESLLYQVVRNREIDAIRLLKKLFPEAFNPFISEPAEGRNSIHHAVDNDDTAVLAVLLEGLPEGSPINQRDFEGKTPLHLCCSEQAAQLLIDAGADVNALDAVDNITPLSCAISQEMNAADDGESDEYFNIIKLLVEKDALLPNNQSLIAYATGRASERVLNAIFSWKQEKGEDLSLTEEEAVLIQILVDEEGSDYSLFKEKHRSLLHEESYAKAFAVSPIYRQEDFPYAESFYEAAQADDVTLFIDLLQEKTDRAKQRERAHRAAVAVARSSQGDLSEESEVFFAEEERKISSLPFKYPITEKFSSCLQHFLCDLPLNPRVHQAAKRSSQERSFECLRQLFLCRGIAPNAVDSWGDTPLHKIVSKWRSITSMFPSILNFIKETAPETFFIPNSSGLVPFELVLLYPFERSVVEQLFDAMMEVDSERTKALAEQFVERAASYGLDYVLEKLFSEEALNLQSKQRVYASILKQFCVNDYDGLIPLFFRTHKGISPSIPLDQRGNTALHVAVYGGFSGVVDVLLDLEDIGVNASNRDGWMPLHFAAKRSKEVFVRKLLAAGADVNAAGDFNTRVLHIAVSQGDAALVTFLVEQGAFIDCQDDDGRTPLHLAVVNGDNRIISYLQDCGARQLSDQDGLTPFSLSCAIGNVEAARILYDRSVNIYELRDNHSNTVLHVAAQRGHSSILRFLSKKKQIRIGFRRFLDKNFRKVLNAKNIEGESVFHLLAKSFNPDPDVDSDIVATEFAKMLIALGADSHTRNNNGDTPLLYACQRGKPQLAALLQKENPFEAFDTNLQGETPFHVAIEEGYEKIAISLLKNLPWQARMSWIAPNGKLYFFRDTRYNARGFSPFHLAVKHLQKDIVVKMLDKTGHLSKLRMRNKKKTALHLLLELEIPASDKEKLGKRVEILKMLTLLDPKTVCMRDDNGDSPFHILAKNTSFEAHNVRIILEVLLQALRKVTKNSLKKFAVGGNGEGEIPSTIARNCNNDTQIIKILHMIEGVFLRSLSDPIG